MVPNKIHYCWFGGKPLPELAKNCIASWKKYMPDAEIIEWNEKNFDIHSNKYIEEAYKEKKWAFVSDYARIKILYEHGGIYFDTDVKMIRPIYDIMSKGSFLAMELPTGSISMGLGFGTEKNNPFLGDLLSYYENTSFNPSKLTTIVQIVSEYFYKDKSYKQDNVIQKCKGFIIYPTEFFCPYNYETGIMNITKNTRCIHLYDGSWLDGQDAAIKIRRSYIMWGYKNFLTKIIHKIYSKLILTNVSNKQNKTTT